MIRILDAATVGRIAAGEVVERPSSVAKELIENALDAGASSITVEMRDGGERYLRVTDNGCGIPAQEARLAFENHATSKLRDGDDLSDIRTLGFRGEALPSIAAVSKVEMATRIKGAESGIRLIIEGGKFVGVEDAGCPEGTTIIVRDLFFNVPARRSFLKKPGYEAGVLSEMVEKLILANPSVAIRLISNGKTLVQSFGDDSMLNTALCVYGREVASLLKPVELAEGGMRIWGLVGVGDCARPNRSDENFFINGRVVRCPLLSYALEEACRGRVTIGMYPICALHLLLPPSSIDVNVHPNKLEIRFRDEVAIRASVDAMFGRIFEREHMTDLPKEPIPEPRTNIQYIPPQVAEQTEVVFPNPSVPQKQTEVSDKSVAAPEPSLNLRSCRSPEPGLLSAIRPVLRSPSESLMDDWLGEDAPPIEPSEVPDLPQQDIRPDTELNYRLIGVFDNTYLLVEQDHQLIMIDQHAAHERILYEKYKGLLESGHASQQLLTPLILSTSVREQAILLNNLETLKDAGFEVEPFGEREIVVRAVPYVLSEASLSPFFMEMLDRLDKLRSAALDRKRGEIIQLSCKRAVKAGDKLSESEIRALLEEMKKTNAPPNCPHGRPVLRVFRLNEIERMFKRLQ